MVDENLSVEEVEPEIIEIPEEKNIDLEKEEISETKFEEKKEEPPKKKPGRPKDSKDVKPRPSRKIHKKEEPVEDPIIKEELPRAIPDSLPIPEEPETDKAALMLELLRRQTQIRKKQKEALWKSWFI